jgi:hypothetical protein
MHSKFLWALAGPLVAAGLFGCSRAGQSAGGAPKITSEREVCLAIEDTFKMITLTQSEAIKTAKNFKTAKEAHEAADEFEAKVRLWNQKRPTLDAEPAKIGDAFAVKFAARAKLLRAATDPAPRPTPTALSSTASPEERKKAALEDAARVGVKGLFGEGALDPGAEYDHKALWKNHEEMSEVQGEYLDACIRLMHEDDLKR